VSSVVFVDTSAFYAPQNRGDLAEHALACETAVALESEKAVLVTTDYILDEAYTLLRSVLGHKVAIDFGRELRLGGIDVVQVGEEIQREAWAIFEGYADKDFSFTDCTSFTVMRHARIKQAFTFDQHFRQYGFSTLPHGTLRRRK
jgi:hypothetical protein